MLNISPWRQQHGRRWRGAVVATVFMALLAVTAGQISAQATTTPLSDPSAPPARPAPAGRPAPAADQAAAPAGSGQQPLRLSVRADARHRSPDGKLPKRKAMRPAEARTKALEGAFARDQRSYLDTTGVRIGPDGSAVTPLTVSLPNQPDENWLRDCLDSPNAHNVYGRTYNRYMWCSQFKVEVSFHTVESDGDIEYEGKNTMTYTSVAFGTNQEHRMRMFFRIEKDSVEYDDWGPLDTLFVAPYMNFEVMGDCAWSAVYCIGTGPPIRKAFHEWNKGGEWFSWDIWSQQSNGTGVDKVNRFEWRLQFDADGRIGGTDYHAYPAITPPRWVRCDSADYFKWGGRTYDQACILDDVIPHITYRTGDAAVAKVAEHIACAQQLECFTYPIKPTAKAIPGKFIPGNRRAPALRRVPVWSGIPDDNRWHVRAACANRAPYAGVGLPTPPAAGEQCDEYPFASTLEGAANTFWDFSVRAVPQSHNSVAGGRLNWYYFADRILHYDDPFYVNIQAGGGGGGGEGDGGPVWPGPFPRPAPPYDSPPTADAGPDVSGDEGSPIRLHGSAGDEEGAPTVRWTYTAGANVDPGASCQFAESGTAETTLTCTDDGTYTVTLAADDGVNAAATDSATVTVRNVAPELTLTEPAPWQVYRAGAAVDVGATFTDPGSNDTHTCTIEWDDGTRESTAAAGRSCGRRHTFRHAGMYTMTVGVGDDDGGTDSAKVMVIVYDPEVGVASGNGWLHRAGTGGFDFLGSYIGAQATTPQGAVTFSDADAGLSLRAHHRLEWVVITPDGKVAIKGEAERIPGQNVGFLLYAFDGCGSPGAGSPCRPGKDRLRMVVWDLAAGPIPDGVTPLYDNRAGRSLDVDQAEPQDISSGVVQIQRSRPPGRALSRTAAPADAGAAPASGSSASPGRPR